WTAPGAAYGLVGMAALFAAAAEAPMTAILIVFEMSNDYTIILPLMVCVVIATVLGRRLLGSTVYEMKLIRRGIDWQRVRRPRFLSRVNIGTIRRDPPVVAQLNDEISSVAMRDGEAGELAVPVCSGRRFIGIVSSADLARAIAEGHGNDRVSTIVQTMSHVLHADDTVERAATLMADAPVPLLPVVDPHDEHLLGIVTRRDVLQAYRSLADV
ncbi:MAG TPA: CBS domain-containing protein, partial [Alphaproteobacteria bacterium]|nr:CBS domain-containing protein [Alphaproteobacteria bacterium]